MLQLSTATRRTYTTAHSPQPTANVGRQRRKGPLRLPLKTEISPKHCSPKFSTEPNPVRLVQTQLLPNV